MVPRKRDDAVDHHRAAEAIAPAISAEKMSYGLMLGVALTWLLSVIVSISSLFSVSYIRYQTDSIRRSLLPASCQPTEYNDYELIHIDCPLHTTTNFKIPKQFEGRIIMDPETDLKSAVFFDMSMEMFQTGKWYDHIHRPGSQGRSLSDSKPAARNSPNYFPSLDGLGRQFATAVYAGNYLLEPSILPRLFQNRKLLKVRDQPQKYFSGILSDASTAAAGGGPPLKITASNTQAFDNAIYTSEDPRNPREGDLRIRFFINSATHISAIGIQAPPQLSSYSSSFKKWLDENIPQILGHGIIRSIVPFDDKYLNYTGTLNPNALNPSSASNYGPQHPGRMMIMREGDYDADQLLSLYERENDAFANIHWYALSLFGLTTSALAWVVLRRCMSIPATSGPVVIISGVFLTFGATLMLASIPNIITTWRLGVLQLIAAAAAMAMAYWSFSRAPDIYSNYSCLGACETRPSIRYRSALLQDLAAGRDHVGLSEVYGKSSVATSQPLIPKIDQSAEVIVEELQRAHPNRSYAAV